jgi:hypothetical protein
MYMSEATETTVEKSDYQVDAVRCMLKQTSITYIGLAFNRNVSV